MSDRLPGQGDTFPEFVITGVDGGGTTGIAKLTLSHPEWFNTEGAGGRVPRWRFTRVTAELTETFSQPNGVLRLVSQGLPNAVAVEDFVQLRRAGRMRGQRTGGKKAADIAALIATCHTDTGCSAARSFRNNASRAKKWATDRRLTAAGITGRGMGHARDGARHALFVAVQQGWLSDPLVTQQQAAQRHREGSQHVPAANFLAQASQPAQGPSVADALDHLPEGTEVTEFGPGALSDEVLISLPTEIARTTAYARQAELYAQAFPESGSVEMFVTAPESAGGTAVHRALADSIEAEEMATIVRRHRGSGRIEGTL